MCLTGETTETLYLLGEGDRIVGISGNTVRPARGTLQAEGTLAATATVCVDVGFFLDDLAAGPLLVVTIWIHEMRFNMETSPTR